MSTTNWLFALAAAAAIFAVVLLAAWRRHPNVAAVLVVAGIVALGVVVSVDRVNEFQQQQTLQQEVARNTGTAPQPLAGSGGSAMPMQPPGIVPAPMNLMRGAAGAAAPAAAKDPYLGAGNP